MLATCAGTAAHGAGEPHKASDAERWLAAYPAGISAITRDTITFQNGSSLARTPAAAPIDSAPAADWIAPQPLELVRTTDTPFEPAGRTVLPTDFGYRVSLPVVEQLYGQCGAADFAANITTVGWFDQPDGVAFARAHGAAESLARVATELAKLPDHFQEFLVPLERTFECGAVDATLARPGLFSYGIALRLNPRFRSFWRWTKPDEAGRFLLDNAIPDEIVSAFERNGFVWGGRWRRYDTTYFEYRPELAPPRRRAGAN